MRLRLMRLALLTASCVLMLSSLSIPSAYAGEKTTIAAVADLKFALDEIVVLFNKAHPADQVETTSKGVRAIMARYGFVLPSEAK